MTLNLYLQHVLSSLRRLLCHHHREPDTDIYPVLEHSPQLSIYPSRRVPTRGQAHGRRLVRF